jgi:hypothetical protein
MHSLACHGQFPGRINSRFEFGIAEEDGHIWHPDAGFV